MLNFGKLQYILLFFLLKCGHARYTTCRQIYHNGTQSFKSYAFLPNSTSRQSAVTLSQGEQEIISWAASLAPHSKAHTQSFKGGESKVFLKAHVFTTRGQITEEATREWAGVQATAKYPKTPKVIQCYEFEDRLLFVFEYFPKTLYAAILEGFLSPPQKVSIALQITQIIADLQTLKIIHGDLSASNFMCLKEDCLTVLIIDFGHSSVGHFGQSFGTCEYLAPERGPGLKVVRQTWEMEYWALAGVIIELIDPRILDFFSPFVLLNCDTRIEDYIEFQRYLSLKINHLSIDVQKSIRKWFSFHPWGRSSAQEMHDDILRHGADIFISPR